MLAATCTGMGERSPYSRACIGGAIESAPTGEGERRAKERSRLD